MAGVVWRVLFGCYIVVDVRWRVLYGGCHMVGIVCRLFCGEFCLAYFVAVLWRVYYGGGGGAVVL